MKTKQPLKYFGLLVAFLVAFMSTGTLSAHALEPAAPEQAVVALPLEAVNAPADGTVTDDLDVVSAPVEEEGLSKGMWALIGIGVLFFGGFTYGFLYLIRTTKVI